MGRASVARMMVASGVTAAVVSLIFAWMSRDSVEGIEATLLLGSLLLGVAANACSALGWARLVDPGRHGHEARWSYYAAVLGKYVPLGVAQQATMVATLARVSAHSLREASGLAAVQAGVSIISAAMLVVPAALVGALNPLLAAGTIASLLAVYYLGRIGTRLPQRVADKLRSFRAALGLDSAVRAVPYAIAWNVLGFIAMGASFGFALAGIGGSSGMAVDAAVVFPVAWLAGFVVWFLPAGAGARESVLVLLLGSTPLNLVVAAALVHRLVILLADVVTFIVFRGWKLPTPKSDSRGQSSVTS